MPSSLPPARLAMNVTFRQLRVFVEVAKHASMSQAAQALHLSPPAISMQIRQVESQVGLALFDRVGRQVSLSTAGEYFLVHARCLLASLKEAEDAMARLKQLERGMLTIGIVSTAKYFVPHLLARFHEEHPGVDVRLRVLLDREQLVALMQAGEVDLSVMGRPPRELAARAEAFAVHPLVFVCGSHHALLGSAPVPARLLDGQAFIVREHGSGTRAAMAAFFAQRQVVPRITMEMPSNETIKQAVIAGMGLGFLSLHTIGLELRAGLLHILEVEETPLMRSWNVVHLQSRVLSPAAESFRYFIIERGQAYLAAHDDGLLPPARPAAGTRRAR